MFLSDEQGGSRPGVEFGHFWPAPRVGPNHPPGGGLWPRQRFEE